MSRRPVEPDPTITFVTHTASPGGAELALRRYLEVTELPARLVTLEPGGVWEGLDREVVAVGGVRHLRHALRGAGLVVANTMRAAFLSALVAPRGTRLVYWVRDGLTQSAMSPLALTLTKQVTARRAVHYLANSQWTAGTVRDALGVAEERVSVVYSLCGVGDEQWSAPRRRPVSPVRLLYLGRLTPWKAPHLAIEALTELRARGVDATLTLAGDAHFGEDRYVERLRDQVANDPAVSMVGHVADVWGVLAAHDILIHCSVVPEPFGQVIVQGLAAGLPVTASRLGGPREILEGSPVDLTHAPGAPDEIADVVIRALDHYDTVHDWGHERAASYRDRDLASAADRALMTIDRAFTPDRQEPR